LLWAKGDETEARTVVERLLEEQQRTGRQFGANYQVILETLVLALRGASEESWLALLERANRYAQGLELIEILEVRGIVAAREKKPDLARAVWERALQLGGGVQRAMESRIRGRLAELGPA
jgi:hypothetical protein